MPETGRNSVYTIPAHRGFADALATYLLERFGKGELGLAQGLILLPTNRAGRAITEAFVRRSEAGLLLPRMAAIGDLELDETLGNALAPIDADLAIPPAIDPLSRRMGLARLIAAQLLGEGERIGAGEALRVADGFAKALDQLAVEGQDVPSLIRRIAIEPELSGHWSRAYSRFQAIDALWRQKLTAEGLIEPAERRNRLLDALNTRWRDDPPKGFVVAAGITSASPAIARLLRTVAGLPNGMVVLPHFDLRMDDEEWAALAPADPDDPTPRRPLETHPQFNLRLLLERMGIAREEVTLWPRLGEGAAPSARARVIGQAFAPPRATANWIDLKSEQRSLSGVRLLEASDSGEEARAIAILVREALEVPERRVAIVTPDRELARRIGAILSRWRIEADDSAGRKLSELPPGTFALALAHAVATRFAPVELLTLLKHPLAGAGEGRVAWLGAARALDLALRGLRPAPGLDGIDRRVAEAAARRDEDGMAAHWANVRKVLAPVAPLGDAPRSLSHALDLLRAALDQLSHAEVWRGEAGRALAALFADAEAVASQPQPLDGEDLAAALAALLDSVTVRPSYGGHPRVAIYGLIEARQQHADLVICAGLNEGIWPGAAAPDPWLAPSIRRIAGLPTLERGIGLAAHDLAGAMGAPEVVLTRAARDRSGPTTPSRFLLRFMALAGGGLARETDALALARGIDDPRAFIPEERPAPMPSAKQRKVRLSVTDFDGLKADPYSFYARAILGLRTLDPLDMEPNARWRGTMVHDILEHWAREDDREPAKLIARAEAMLDALDTHPLMRALWRGRLLAGIEWIAARTSELAATGRVPVAIEQSGTMELDGLLLKGRADRIDQLPDGSLAIVDYKTGVTPSNRKVAAGFTLQLGLIGLLAEAGKVDGVRGKALAFEYWSLGKNRDGGFGHVASPVTGRTAAVPPEQFVGHAMNHAREAIARWLNGDEAFTAKLRPDFASYEDYDQLMRLDEWYGRLIAREGAA